MTFLILTVCTQFAIGDTCEAVRLHGDPTPMTRAACAMEVVGWHKAKLEFAKLGQFPTLPGIDEPVIGAQCASAVPCDCEEPTQ